VSGVAADRFGGKQLIIIGLIMLGLSFALLSFFGITQANIILYLALSGIAWGSSFVVFLAVPGDLSAFGSREKFYGLGYILPIAILFGLSAIPGDSILVDFPASSFSQVLSLILFSLLSPCCEPKKLYMRARFKKEK